MRNILSPRITFICVALVASLSSGYTPPSKAAAALEKFRGFSELTSAAGSMDLDIYAKNMITWQMGHGGFSKAYASKYLKPWDGKAELSSWTGTKDEPLGMFDNNATIQEMRFLAARYKATGNASNKTAFKAAFGKALGFVLASQLPNGGWPQVHPKRGNYSDMATYNDNAMVRVMVLVKDIVDRKAPFDGDLVSTADAAKLEAALDKAVEFALKAQIVNGGVPTVWCAQHDPSSYKPVGARSYELPSKSGSESAGVVWFLMNWPDQTAVVQKAAKGALAWYRKNRVADLKFSKGEFLKTSGASMWYRFYEVDRDAYFFCDREGASTKTQDITKLSTDRRTGYQWGGDYGSALLDGESAYLSALGSSVSVASRHGVRHAAAVSEGLVRIDGLEDGLWDGAMVDASGSRIAAVRGVSIDGRFAAVLPAPLRSRASFVVLDGPGSSRRTILLAGVLK